MQQLILGISYTI